MHANGLKIVLFVWRIKIEEFGKMHYILTSFINCFTSLSAPFPLTVSNLFNPVVLEVVISSCLRKHIMWWNPDSQHWKGLCESVLSIGSFSLFQTFLKGALSTFSGSQKYKKKFLVKYSFPVELSYFFFFCFCLRKWLRRENLGSFFFRAAILLRKDCLLIAVPKFKECLDNTPSHDSAAAGSPVRSREEDLRIPLGPFQCEMLCDGASVCVFWLGTDALWVLLGDCTDSEDEREN